MNLLLFAETINFENVLVDQLGMYLQIKINT